MGDCPHLEMLPKLPLNIEYIDASNCTTLETLSLRPESDFKPSFCLLNCDKLIKNQGYGDLFSTMLRHYITQGSSDSSYEKSTQVVIPGSEIPKWFSHQNVGASVNLQRPSDLLALDLQDRALLYPTNLVRLNRISFGWNIFPLDTLGPLKKN
ncbi:hypothetical protein ACJW30_12G004500 [Castanea mollissima]